MLQKAIFIKNFALQSCHTPWQVVLRTGGRADLNLVLGFVNTNPKDFVRFLLRPKGARTQRHGIRSLLTNEAAAEDELIPDTAKLAADATRLITGLEAPVYSDGIMHVWEILNPLESAIYKFLVVNLVEDFAFDWYSGILLAPESSCSIGRFSYIKSGSGLCGSGFQRVNFNLTVFAGGNVFRNSQGIQLGDGLWFISATMNAGKPFGYHGTGKLFGKFGLGDPLSRTCGDIVEADMAEYPLTNEKVWTRLIQGPDTLNVHLEQTTSPHVDCTESGFVTINGFRLS